MKVYRERSVRQRAAFARALAPARARLLQTFFGWLENHRKQGISNKLSSKQSENHTFKWFEKFQFISNRVW